MAALNENAITMVSSTTVTFASATQTTLYTVPTSKTFIWLFTVIVTSADCSTATVTLGKSTALTSFLGTQTLVGLNGAGSVGILQPIPNATTVEGIKYTAGDILQVDVTATGGGTAHVFKVFGLLY